MPLNASHTYIENPFFSGSEGTLGTTLGNKHTPILHSPDQECHPGNSA